MSTDFDLVQYRPRERDRVGSRFSSNAFLAAIWFAFGAFCGALVTAAAVGLGPATPVNHEHYVAPRPSEPVIRYVYRSADKARVAESQPVGVYANATADAPIGTQACVDGHVMSRVENGWIQVYDSGRVRRC